MKKNDLIFQKIKFKFKKWLSKYRTDKVLRNSDISVNFIMLINIFEIFIFLFNHQFNVIILDIILFNFSSRNISNVKTYAIILLNRVLFNSGLWIHGHQNTHIFVFYYFIVFYDRNSTENHYSIIVFRYLIVFNPNLSWFNNKDSFTPSSLYLVIHNISVYATITIIQKNYLLKPPKAICDLMFSKILFFSMQAWEDSTNKIPWVKFLPL